MTSAKICKEFAMPEKFDHEKIEAKWQKKWKESGIYATDDEPSKKKYILDMFPYPSGSTMHVGHLEGYVGTDILSRFLRMNGYSVLHPMGWDAFGLPAENYAIKTGVSPDKSTHENIKTFKRQLEISGMSYDWSKEIDTSSPEFYKWTQWLFIQLYKKGLAYKKKAPVNWCPKDETVLANEQVVDGKCERCDTPVVQKELDQWFFKITEYADRLISGLDGINWPEDVKRQQINWIGKKEGINIRYQVADLKDEIEVFTTAPVNFGMTFLVLSPEHELVKKIINGDVEVPEENKKNVTEYVETAQKKTELERSETGNEKTGVFTGLFVINPINDKKVPVWVTDFVLGNVGTGAVQGCPAHDKRDFQFAKKFGLPIVRVVVGEDGYDGPVENEDQIVEHGSEGKFVNSEFLNGMGFEEGLQKTMDYFLEKGRGKRVIEYHLRDWLISRQRYWGCPIPMIYCSSCSSQGGSLGAMPGWFPVEEKDLPVLLPTDIDFLPHGESPIERSKTFQKDVICPNCGKPAKREVDTMDTYVDSSWYFIRFADPKNNKEFISLEATKKWLPVDDYVGGGHVVQHLLFARFFWKVLYDAGLLDKSLGDEPFLKLRAPGWILGSDSRKMSKRWGNVVTPDDIIPKFGADTLRVYEMFMGPFDVMKPWSTSGVEGSSRFLGKVWRLFVGFSPRSSSTFLETAQTTKNSASADAGRSLVLSKLHQTIKKVTNDIEEYKFNTAISSLMELVNIFNDYKVTDPECLKTLVLLLAPFAPHMAEEIWVEVLGQPFSVHTAVWPKYDDSKIVSDTVTVIVQINGKVRSQLNLQSPVSNLQSKVEELAKNDEKVAKWIEGKKILKTIFIPGKIINFVIENS